MASPASPDFAGTDRFAVRRRLGAGGMGVVYLVHDRDRDASVALKLLPRADPHWLSRFKREFRSLTEILHPNLIELYELVGEGDQWFFTMRVVDGVDFLTWIGDPRGDGYRRVREACRQLVLGVQAVHAAGRLHRDLKPSNVMVEPDGHVVILDFGLVSELGVAPDGGELAGTAAHMAPEQWTDAPLTAGVDWYGVGVVLFQALTGRLPFVGSRSEVLGQKLAGDGPPPSSVVPGIPEDLDTLCRDLLRRDPQERPGPGEILARLDPTEPGIRDTPSHGIEQPVDLVGREQQVLQLTKGFAAVRDGLTVTAHVHGPSGTGKTTLVDHVLSTLAAEPGVVVLRGRCYEQESVPYKAVDSLIDALAEHLARRPSTEVQGLVPVHAAVLARVFPVLQRVPAIAEAPSGFLRDSDPREVRRVAVAALRELLVRMGQRADVVLAIDDLQWGDLDGALVLEELLAPPDPPRMMLVLSYRSEYIERSPCLATLHQAGSSQGQWHQRVDLPLASLTLAESEALAHRLLAPDAPADFARVARIARESGGNPFFILELSRHVDSETAPGPEAPDHLELDAVLWSRAERLPGGARETLAVVAIAGQPIALRHLLAVVTDRAEVAGALVLLKAEHLVRGAGSRLEDTIEPYHDRVRESVAARLPPELSRRIHAALARAFEAAGPVDPETIAKHHERAGDAVAAGTHYARAARAAAETLAFDRAATLYRKALETPGLDGAARSAMHRELGHALANAGRGYHAAQAYEAAVASASPADRFELERLAAAQYCFSGHIREGRTIFRRLLRQTGLSLPDSPLRIVSRLLWRRARLRWRGMRFTERAEAQVSAERIRQIDLLWSITAGLSIPDALGVASLQTQALMLALDAGEPYRVARALAFEAFMTSIGGTQSVDRTAQLMHQAESLARRLDHPHAIGVVQLMQQMVAHNQCRFPDVVRLGEEAEETLRTRCRGAWWELAMARTEILWALWHQGDCQAMRRRTPVILADATDRGDLFLVTNLRSVITPFLLLLDDEPDAAIREVGEALAPWPREGFNLQHANEMFSEANALIYRGRGVEALDSVDRRWPALRRSLQLQTQLVRLNMVDLRARATLAAAEREPGRRELLLRRAGRDVARLAREGSGLAAVFVPALRAGMAHLLGQREHTVRHLRGAIAAGEAVHDGLRTLFARHHLAGIVGGEEGAALRTAADAAFAREGIRNPGGLGAVYLPGFRAE